MKAQELKSFISKFIEELHRYYQLSIQENIYKVEVEDENTLNVFINAKIPCIVALRIKAECEKYGCKTSLWYPNGDFYEIKVKILKK